MRTVYGLADPESGQIRYVGIAKDVRRRIKRHIAERARAWHSSRWISGLFARGLRPEMFEIERVDDCVAAEAERFWIAYFRAIGADLTNLTAGGDGCASPAPSVRAAISAALKGRAHSREHVEKNAAAQRGRKLSPEQVQGMRDRRVSDETRRRISAAMTGRPSPHRGRRHSAEARANMSAAKKGRPSYHRNPEHRAKMSDAIRSVWASRRSDPLTLGAILRA